MFLEVVASVVWKTILNHSPQPLGLIIVFDAHKSCKLSTTAVL